MQTGLRSVARAAEWESGTTTKTIYKMLPTKGTLCVLHHSWA